MLSHLQEKGVYGVGGEESILGSRNLEITRLLCKYSFLLRVSAILDRRGVGWGGKGRGGGGLMQTCLVFQSNKFNHHSVLWHHRDNELSIICLEMCDYIFLRFNIRESNIPDRALQW
jgi:hypothetical protein